MSVTVSDELTNSVPANPEVIDCHKNMLVYDICKRKYFIISSFKNHMPLQKGMSPSAKVIGGNFSTNNNSNDKGLPAKEGSSISDIIKNEQFSGSSKDRTALQHAASNLVSPNNQQSNVDSVLKNHLIHDVPKNGSSEEVVSSASIAAAVGESSISNKNNITPSSVHTYSCKDCQKVFDEIYLLALHDCTTIKTYDCESCKERFPNAYTLSRHKQIHMGEKPETDSVLKGVLSLDYNLCHQGGSVIINKNTVTPTPSQTFVCDDCQKVFNSNYLLALHKCTALKSFACESCIMTFPNTYSLNRHKQIHINEKPYEGNSLKESSSDNKFDGIGENNLSIKPHTSSTPTHICESCQKVFENSYRLALHKCTASKSFACETCKMAFPNPYSLSRHQQVHLSKKPSSLDNKLISEESALSDKSTVTPTSAQTYSCHVCLKIFDKSYLLALHKCVTLKPFECDSCNKRFSDASGLKKHHRIHTGEKPYSCNTCNKKFTDGSTLTKHNRIHTGEKPFVCKFCGSRFTQSTHMNNHIKNRHINKKPRKPKPKEKKHYICNFCYKVFPQKVRLYTHFRTHTGEQPYECDTCKKRFSDASSLKRHKRVHTGERPFACGVCDAQFSQSCTLKTHLMDVHMGNDAYVCDICNESFSKKHYFFLHCRSHTGDKPHVCPICGDGFSNQQALRKHQVMHYDERLGKEKSLKSEDLIQV